MNRTDVVLQSRTVYVLLTAYENSLLKRLYVGILKASERWTHPIQNWNLTLAQLAIHFPARLKSILTYNPDTEF